MMTLHASALFDFQTAVRVFESNPNSNTYAPIQAEVSKVIEVRDGAEGLTKEVIDGQLRAR